MRELVAAFHGAAADHPQVAESIQSGWRDRDRRGGAKIWRCLILFEDCGSTDSGGAELLLHSGAGSRA